MKIREIYEFVIEKGLEKDPRLRKEMANEMKRARREYKALKRDDRIYFDKERFKHPYSDTRILYGDREKSVRTIMIGVDVGGEELLTAYLMNEKGAGVDLAISHHPSGRALANLYEVMHIHTDVLRYLGVDKEIAHSVMKERIDEVSRRLASGNHERNVDIARLLNIPFMCMHTPADNHVSDFLKQMFDKQKPKKVRDVLKILKTIPEYKDAMFKGAGPCLISGKGDKDAGRVFVDMTGGTEGSKKIFGRLSQAGVKTIVAMHLSEEHLKAAKAEFINVVVAGHIASDALGLNLLLDKLVKKCELNIIPCSGFTRVKR